MGASYLRGTMKAHNHSETFLSNAALVSHSSDQDSKQRRPAAPDRQQPLPQTSPTARHEARTWHDLGNLCQQPQAAPWSPAAAGDCVTKGTGSADLTREYEKGPSTVLQLGPCPVRMLPAPPRSSQQPSPPSHLGVPLPQHSRKSTAASPVGVCGVQLCPAKGSRSSGVSSMARSSASCLPTAPASSLPPQGTARGLPARRGWPGSPQAGLLQQAAKATSPAAHSSPEPCQALRVEARQAERAAVPLVPPVLTGFIPIAETRAQTSCRAGPGCARC